MTSLLAFIHSHRCMILASTLKLYCQDPSSTRKLKAAHIKIAIQISMKRCTSMIFSSLIWVKLYCLWVLQDDLVMGWEFTICVWLCDLANDLTLVFAWSESSKNF